MLKYNIFCYLFVNLFTIPLLIYFLIYLLPVNLFILLFSLNYLYIFNCVYCPFYLFLV
jgi:hypothetical protein